MEVDKLRVETPLGILVAEPSDNPDYPGIYISIERRVCNGKEVRLHDIALVEAVVDPIGGFDPYLYGRLWTKPVNDGFDPNFDEVIDLSGIDGDRSVWIDDETGDAENPSYDVIVWDEDLNERDEDLSRYKIPDKLTAENYIYGLTRAHRGYRWDVRAMVKK